MVTRIGNRLVDVIWENKATRDAAWAQVKEDVTQLHDVGLAHCDIYVDNVHADAEKVVLSDDFLTPIEDCPQHMTTRIPAC